MVEVGTLYSRSKRYVHYESYLSALRAFQVHKRSYETTDVFEATDALDEAADTFK